MSNDVPSYFPELLGQHLYPSVSTEDESCNGNHECLFFIYVANVIFCHHFQAPGGDGTKAERKSERALKRFFVQGSGCGCRPSSRFTLNTQLVTAPRPDSTRSGSNHDRKEKQSTGFLPTSELHENPYQPLKVNSSQVLIWEWVAPLRLKHFGPYTDEKREVFVLAE